MTETFRELPGFTTNDGHRYVSVPVSPIPHVWRRWVDNDRVIHYRSSDYDIARRPYAGERVTYSLRRFAGGRWVDLGITGFSLLRDAQALARQNARGEHVVNWA